LKVFVLWLRIQHHYTCDAIGIKMTYRNLPYHEGIRTKTRCKYKLHENKHKNNANPLHTFRKLSITWSYPVVLNVGWFAIQWHVQPYTIHMILKKLKMTDWAWIAEVRWIPVAILHHFILSKSLLLQWLFNLPLVAQWINFCLMYSFIMLCQVDWLY